jgi:hypothetical protein
LEELASNFVVFVLQLDLQGGHLNIKRVALWENSLSFVHEIAAGIVLYPSKFEVCLVVLQLDENMIKRLRKKLTENYVSWCRFVRQKHNLR